MPPTRTAADQALIGCLPTTILQRFRDSIYQEAYVEAHAGYFNAGRDWVTPEPLHAWLERRAPTAIAPCVETPVVRSDDDEALIRYLPARILELFRNTVRNMIMDLVVTPHNTPPPPPAHIIKSEPTDVAMTRLSDLPRRAYRVRKEGDKEVLELESSDSDDDFPPLPKSSASTRVQPPHQPQPAAASRPRTRVTVEAEIDVDDVSHRGGSLPPDSRFAFEPESSFVPSSPPSMPSSDFEMPASDYSTFSFAENRSGPRAPADHRSPESFNRHHDWRASGTDWGDPKIKSFIRDTHFKPTSHRDPVEAVEYLFEVPPYIPVPTRPTAIVVDLDHPKHDLGDPKNPGSLKTVLARIRKECHDSWDGSSGTAASDSKPRVTYGPGEAPIKSYRARLTCRGGYCCSLVDPALSNVERRYLDQDSREAIFAAERKTRAEEGLTEAQRVTEFVNVSRSMKCAAVDVHGNACKGRPLLIPSKFSDGPRMYIGCSGWTPNFKSGHARRKITVNYDMFERAWHGEAMIKDTSKDTSACAAFIPPSTGNRKHFCDHSHVVNGAAKRGAIVHHACKAACTVFYPVDPHIRKAMILPDASEPHVHPLTTFLKLTAGVELAYTELIAEAGPLSGATVSKVDNSPAAALKFGGMTPGQFAPALQSNVVKSKLIRKAKSAQFPAGVGIPGVYHMYKDDLQNPDLNKRYVHRFVTTEDGGTIVITCFARLLALLDEVNSFEADATFKRVSGSLNEWEVVVFYKALNRSITVARVYIDRADADFFELVFDELRAVKLKLTGKPLAFKRLVPGGNLTVFNSDMESAQVLGAARSFLKTNDPAYSGIPNDITPQEFAPEVVKLCITHAKRAILDFEKLVKPRDYQRLLNFADEIKSEADLDAFSDFIGSLNVKKIQDWWKHKEMSAWILPCLVKGLSPLSSDDWDATPSTTNAGESQHHWTNTLTGIKLPPVEAIERARIVDTKVEGDVELAFRTGALPNPYSNSAQRKARGVTHDATKTRKIQEAHARTEETERLEDELEEVKRQQKELTERAKELKVQKKEAGGTRGRGTRATAGDSSCGRVKSRPLAVPSAPLHSSVNGTTLHAAAAASLATADMLDGVQSNSQLLDAELNLPADNLQPVPSSPQDVPPASIAENPMDTPPIFFDPLNPGPEWDAFLTNLGLLPGPNPGPPTQYISDYPPEDLDALMSDSDAPTIPFYRRPEYMLPLPQPSPSPPRQDITADDAGPSAKPTRKRKQREESDETANATAARPTRRRRAPRRPDASPVRAGTIIAVFKIVGIGRSNPDPVTF
ncbi:hypothetical protein C8F01DRAFT_1264748 [Mycena amicta]|nr:hypothetical protein C8F01DRAFT_1264748 [Mycena amicta]